MSTASTARGAAPVATHPITWAVQMIRERDLKPAQSLTLLLLSIRSDYQTGIVWAGSEKLGRDSNVARRYSKKILKWLEQQKLLEAIEWQRTDGSSGANLYILQIPNGATRESALRRLTELGGKPLQGRGIYRSPSGDQQTPLPGFLDPPRGINGSSGNDRSPQDDTQFPRMGELGVPPSSGNVSIQGTSTVGIPNASLSPASKPGANDATAYRKTLEALMRELPLVTIKRIPAEILKELLEKAVPIETVESACWVSLARSLGKGKTQNIVSFRYFMPAIEELMREPLLDVLVDGKLTKKRALDVVSGAGLTYAGYCKKKTLEALALIQAGKFPLPPEEVLLS